MSSTLPGSTSKKEGRQATRVSLKGFDYQEYGLVGVVILILIIGGILESSFLTEDNMLNVLRQGSIVGVLAIFVGLMLNAMRAILVEVRRSAKDV